MISSLLLLDVITETLVQKSSYLQNIEIVSNMMQFDSKGVLIGFCEPVVHSYNKGVTALAKMNHLNDKLQVCNIINGCYTLSLIKPGHNTNL